VQVDFGGAFIAETRPNAAHLFLAQIPQALVNHKADTPAGACEMHWHHLRRSVSGRVDFSAKRPPTDMNSLRLQQPSIAAGGNDTILSGVLKYSAGHFIDRHSVARRLLRLLVARRNAADHIGKIQA
jgi:hypothetical protein